MTSANAVRAIAQHPRRDELRSTAVFTVGDRTAQAMRDCGFATVTSAAGNVDDLATLVVARLKPPARLLYLAGEERSGDLAGLLREQNFTVHTALVYRAVVATDLPRNAADALAAGLGGVLHFSRRSAEAYVNAARNSGVLRAGARKSDSLLPVRPDRRAAAGRRRDEYPDRGAARRSGSDRTLRLIKPYCTVFARYSIARRRHVAAKPGAYYAVECNAVSRLQGHDDERST